MTPHKSRAILTVNFKACKKYTPSTWKVETVQLHGKPSAQVHHLI